MSTKTRTTTKPRADAEAPLSADKRRAFTVVMVLLPVLFFVALEGGLRLFGYGADYPLFEPIEDFPHVLTQNREVARRYFVHEQNVPNANADYFLRDKPAGTVRLVAQGGSSAAGFPYYWGAAFPRVLGTRLRAAYPERTFEVVNTAMAAVNSYTLLDFADEIIAQDPDAVLIYAGHNEYYGALGAASSESVGRNPALVRTLLRLRRFRTVQWLRNVIANVRSATAGRAAGERPSNTLMARMIGEQAVPVGSEVFEDGLTQFRSNLDALLTRYAEAGIPVYIGTLASNERDQRPFVTVHGADADTTAWNAAMAEGQRAMATGDTTGAVTAFRRATGLDSVAAEGFFRYGEALLAAGEADAARESFVRAKDLDALRFRAPEVFNAAIRELAARHGATVVESQQALRDASLDGVIGEAMMLEHLHPTLDGYAAIADAFFETYTAAADLGTPQPTLPGARLSLATPVDSLTGLIRTAALTEEWPFRPDEARPLDRDTSRTPTAVFDLADRYFQNEVSWQEATDQLATLYAQRGELERAIRTRQALIQAYPFLPDPYEQIGNLQMTLAQTTGRNEVFDDAEASFRAALARSPNRGTSLSLLGALLLQKGATEEATATLERAVRAQPQNQQALYNLSGAYALAGRLEEARTTVGQLLEINPNHQAGRALLASISR